MLRAPQIAPDLTLPLFGGGESHFYDNTGKLAVIIFYKFSCPTCQFAFPFLQQIYDAYGDAFYFVAIAQDGPELTEGFRERFGISIPTLMDLPPYPVSRSYEIVSVPSIFLVESDHRILYSEHGFVKQEFLNLTDLLAEKSGRSQIDIFGDADIPEFKPG